MPTYDYRCDATQKVYEVQHAMSEKLTTWAQLCHLLGIEPGDTAPESPVTRLISGGSVVKSSVLKNPEAPPCMSSGGCSGAGCGI